MRNLNYFFARRGNVNGKQPYFPAPNVNTLNTRPLCTFYISYSYALSMFLRQKDFAWVMIFNILLHVKDVSSFWMREHSLRSRSQPRLWARIGKRTQNLLGDRRTQGLSAFPAPKIDSFIRLETVRESQRYLVGGVSIVGPVMVVTGFGR